MNSIRRIRRYPEVIEWFFIAAAVLLATVTWFGCQNNYESDNKSISVWITTSDKSMLFENQGEQIRFNETTQPVHDNRMPVIGVDPSQTFQVMDGFGYTLTGGSALWIHQMADEARANLLHELFTTAGNGIGVSYLRVSIGASDLDPYVFSYSDLPDGETDPDMEQFNLNPDRAYLIPVLREILSIAPDIKILGSPWSPPVWMKSNKNSIGGTLLPEFYDAYALYFVKYVTEMREEGIRIDAITVQNEPLHPGNNPSILMKAAEQAEFIKNHLGPAFEMHAIDTKIIIYDHNLDRIDYPLEILADPDARKYIDGTAFHLYGGIIDSMSVLHEKHPDKNLYFTEQWIGGNSDFRDNLPWHMENLIIGAPRNWSRTVLEWNLAANPELQPHTPGGCSLCLGAVTIDGDVVTRNDAYYIIAHASKFVRPGSVRIHSDMAENLQNVAFLTPEGRHVLIVFNQEERALTFGIECGDMTAMTEIPARSAATYVW
ncbi:MAG: glycoside hydrolase family 30 protein [Cyclonatronaceae bacterium]